MEAEGRKHRLVAGLGEQQQAILAPLQGLAAQLGEDARAQILALMHGGDGDAPEGRAVQRAGGDDLIVLHQHGGEVHARVVIQAAQAQKRLQSFQGLAAHRSPGLKMHGHTSTPQFMV